MNVLDANSNSMTDHRFPWKWNLSDLADIKENALKVFSCFACGGGSCMGYKLAGYTVLGHCEIDAKIAGVYKANLNPCYSFIMDVRDFLNLPDDELPSELFNLDVLDGSPPCSVFSLAGEREDAWHKKKRFAEGQKCQKLDDLFFVFISIAERLRPKMVIAENVKGLISGNARGYVHEIIRTFEAAGYEMQMFLLNSARMGVPQARERVFFVARRKDLSLPRLKLSFHEKLIPFGQVRSENGKPFKIPGKQSWLLERRRKRDDCLADICLRLGLKRTAFGQKIVHDDKPAPTLVASGNIFRYVDACYLTTEDFRNISTFPQDYDFCGRNPQFICGMSVPPVMMANIAREVAIQIFNKDAI